MFTKAEYIEYFEMIAEKERAMVFNLTWLMSRISDRELLEELEPMLRDELRHHEVVGDLIDRIIKPLHEGRVGVRRRLLGDALLRDPASDRVLSCQCLDVSAGGLCVQLSDEVEQGGSFEVEVRFCASAKPFAARVRVAWCREAGEAFYKAGLQFEKRDSAPVPVLPD